MAFNAFIGVSWCSVVIVLLSIMVCSVCQSSLVNIILICFHPFLDWSASSGSMSSVSR